MGRNFAMAIHPERRLAAMHHEKDARDHAYIVVDLVAGSVVLCCHSACPQRRRTSTRCCAPTG